MVENQPQSDARHVIARPIESFRLGTKLFGALPPTLETGHCFHKSAQVDQRWIRDARGAVRGRCILCLNRKEASLTSLGWREASAF